MLAQGNSGHYKKLVPAFGKILERNSGEDLMIWFSAFAKLANTLPLHQDALSELLDLILSFRWFAPNSRHAEVLAAYADLLVQAVAGNKVRFPFFFFAKFSFFFFFNFFSSFFRASSVVFC